MCTWCFELNSVRRSTVAFILRLRDRDWTTDEFRHRRCEPSQVVIFSCKAPRCQSDWSLYEARDLRVASTQQWGKVCCTCMLVFFLRICILCIYFLFGLIEVDGRGRARPTNSNASNSRTKCDDNMAKALRLWPWHRRHTLEAFEIEKSYAHNIPSSIKTVYLEWSTHFTHHQRDCRIH